MREDFPGTGKVVRELLSDASRRKTILAFLQLVLSGSAAALLIWHMLTVFRRVPQEMDFNAWTYIFLHPQESALFNYLIVAASLSVCSFIFYITGFTGFVQKTLEKVNELLLALSCVASMLLVAVDISINVLSLRPAFYLLVALLPVALLLVSPLAGSQRRFARLHPAIPPACLCLVLLALLAEPLLLMHRPVCLMNEYQDLYSETLIDNVYVNNKDFLARIPKDPVDLALLQKLKSEFKADGMRAINVAFLKLEILSSLKEHYDLERRVNGPSSLPVDRPASAHSRGLDAETLQAFCLANLLEYQHQNMARGQINHIGHILNPLNEYKLGRPLKNIYIQYGLGNTFLMDWVMDLFGGLSLQSFYKCYIFYPVYAVLFLLMLYVLFGDSLFMLGSFVVYALAFFTTGFTGFVLAPGLIPSIHFFDVIVVTLFALYLRRRHPAFAFLAALACIASLVVNILFGAMLSIAFALAMAFYIIENVDRKKMLLGLASLLFMLAAGVALARILPATRSGGIKHFFYGYFSWGPYWITVVPTVFYLVVSYLFMLLLKKRRDTLKYLYIFAFLYSQALLVYYYWSGLINHFPTVLPFMGVQFFLMLLIAYNYVVSKREALAGQLRTAVTLMIVPFFAIMLIGAGIYYSQKHVFYENFVNHRLYHWQFPRANVTTTIETSPVKEAVGLIDDYAGADKAVFIISRYDNLLPFLARRYSGMPQFEMPYALIAGKETVEAIESIQKSAPRFLFVDTDIDLRNVPFDPWNKLFFSQFDKNERISRYGRLLELQKIFNCVRDGYEKVAEGRIISVYKRKI